MKKLLILILLVVISLSVKSQEVDFKEPIDITVLDLNDESIHHVIMYKKRNEYFFAIDSVLFIYSNESINKSYNSFEIQKFIINDLSIYNYETEEVENKNISRIQFEYIRDIDTNILSFIMKLDENVFMWKIINAKE